MSWLCLSKYFHWLSANTSNGLSLSLCIARFGSNLQFLHNWLDFKGLCHSRPQLLQFCRPLKTLLFCCNPNSVLFGSGSDDRPMLTQFDQIVSWLQIFFNLDPINVNCVEFVALRQNGWIVGAFLGQLLRTVHSLLLCLQILTVTINCRCIFINCSGRGMRVQNLNAIEVNLSQLYLDSKLSTIEPQSCGLQKKRSSIATGF